MELQCLSFGLTEFSVFSTTSVTKEVIQVLNLCSLYTPVFRHPDHFSTISSSEQVYTNPVSHSCTGTVSALSLELLYRLLCACQRKGLSKIFQTQQVALCLALSTQLCFIWVCLACVCVSAWLLAKLFMPFPVCLSESS